jgi:hypothetical protein
LFPLPAFPKVDYEAYGYLIHVNSSGFYSLYIRASLYLFDNIHLFITISEIGDYHALTEDCNLLTNKYTNSH